MKEKKLQIQGFSSPNGNYRPLTLNILAFGIEGAGKSRFLATAPDPIGGIILDLKSETSIRRAMEESGKQVIWPEPSVHDELIHDLDLTALNKMDQEKYMEHYRRRCDLMIDLLMRLVNSKEIRTIFI